jgi:hypothetical protein
MSNEFDDSELPDPQDCCKHGTPAYEFCVECHDESDPFDPALNQLQREY